MSNFREGVHLFEADPIVQTTIFQLNIPHSIYFGFGHSGYMVADFMVEASSFPQIPFTTPRIQNHVSVLPILARGD